MKAIILAGGKGTRLAGVIRDIPKPMAPIDDKPFLEYLIKYLHKSRVSEVIISTGYKSEIIKTYFGSGEKYDVAISYCEEDEPLGTAGAARKSLGGTHDEHIIVMNGDSFMEMDFNKISAFHKKQSAVATIGLVSVGEAGRYGTVEINDKQEIISFKEKSTHGSGLINGGIYMLDRKIVDYIPEGNISLEKEVFPALAGNGLYGFIVEGFFVDIGVPADYLRLQEDPHTLNLICG